MIKLTCACSQKNVYDVSYISCMVQFNLIVCEHYLFALLIIFFPLWICCCWPPQILRLANGKTFSFSCHLCIYGWRLIFFVNISNKQQFTRWTWCWRCLSGANMLKIITHSYSSHFILTVCTLLLFVYLFGGVWWALFPLPLALSLSAVPLLFRVDAMHSSFNTFRVWARCITLKSFSIVYI